VGVLDEASFEGASEHFGEEGMRAQSLDL